MRLARSWRRDVFQGQSKGPWDENRTAQIAITIQSGPNASSQARAWATRSLHGITLGRRRTETRNLPFPAIQTPAPKPVHRLWRGPCIDGPGGLVARPAARVIAHAVPAAFPNCRIEMQFSPWLPRGFRAFIHAGQFLVGAGQSFRQADVNKIAVARLASTAGPSRARRRKQILFQRTVPRAAETEGRTFQAINPAVNQPGSPADFSAKRSNAPGLEGDHAAETSGIGHATQAIAPRRGGFVLGHGDVSNRPRSTSSIVSPFSTKNVSARCGRAKQRPACSGW